MARFKARLARIAEKLTSNQAQLTKARKRYKAARKREDKAKARARRAETAADKARAEGGFNATGAGILDLEAAKLRRKGNREHDRAIYWRGKIKTTVQKIEGLETRKDKIEAELAKYQREHGVTIVGNKVAGGTAAQRWRTACLTSVVNCSSSIRRNFYSQSGSWDINHEIHPGPSYGERSDCSQYVTGMAWSAGLPDPNGANWTGGYTGTLTGQHDGWKLDSEAKMKKKGWGYVVYGEGTGHHVEAYIGPGERTAGHGSAPVDYGIIDLFGDSDYRCYVFYG